MQLTEPGAGRWERLDTEHTAVGIERGGDVSVEVGINPTGDRARLYDDGYADLRVMPTCGGTWLLSVGGVVELVGIILPPVPSLVAPISEEEERWADRPAGSARFV